MKEENVRRNSEDCIDYLQTKKIKLNSEEINE